MKPIYLKSILNLIGATSAGNGLWMLFFAANWYDNVPAGIHDTGPFNSHFVHDIGLVYLLVGIALIWCAKNLNTCKPIFLVVLLFNVGHALIHVIEILIGLLPPSHWWIDFPLIFFPTMVLVALSQSILKSSKIIAAK